jgi:excisionase family DNA binding protein
MISVQVTRGTLIMKIEGKTLKELREWYSTKGAAEYTGRGVSTLAKERLTGRGCPFIKIGAKVLYKRSDLDAWLESKRVNNTSQY